LLSGRQQFAKFAVRAQIKFRDLAVAHLLSAMLIRGMGKLVEYQVMLSDGGANTYASTSVLATDDADATKKAKDWVASLDTRWGRRVACSQCQW
jgi:hypothetical protein